MIIHPAYMFARFPLHSSERNDVLRRLVTDWWPAALLGILALLSFVPDGDAQSLLGLF
jgi:hypothetical protein